jgi:signal recognition particle receptor subunit beta
MDKTARKEPIRLSEMNFTPILIAVAVVFFTLGEISLKFLRFVAVTRLTCAIATVLVILFLIKKRGVKRTDVLLAGLCDSGKTLLYSLVLNGSEVETFTSLKENFGFLTLPSGVLRLVDLPGHERLRLRLLDTYKNSTKALVYVVDSNTVAKEIKDVAE